MKNIIIITLALSTLYSCKSDQTIAKKHDTFPVTTVLLQDTSSYTDYVAEMHALQNVEIRARVNG
jgi:membrane fusion protein (multidrug efflux system)